MLKIFCLILVLFTNFTYLLSTDPKAPRRRRVVGQPRFYDNLPGKLDGKIPYIDNFYTTALAKYDFGTSPKRKAIIDLAYQIARSIDHKSQAVSCQFAYNDFDKLTLSFRINHATENITEAKLCGLGFNWTICLRNKSDLTKLINQNKLHYYIEESPDSDQSANSYLCMYLQKANKITLSVMLESFGIAIPKDIERELKSYHDQHNRWSLPRAAWIGATLRATPKVSSEQFAGAKAIPGKIPEPIRCHCTLM